MVSYMNCVQCISDISVFILNVESNYDTQYDIIGNKQISKSLLAYTLKLDISFMLSKRKKIRVYEKRAAFTCLTLHLGINWQRLTENNNV